MKKYLKFFAAANLISCLFFTGCLKDSFTRTNTYIFYTPVYQSKTVVKANIKSNAARDIQNPGKIYILGNYIFLNEIDKGIHIIDNSNPSSPKNAAFIDIPGNIDIAVKGNALFADMYTDLVTIDITDPLNAIVKKYNEGVFPVRNYSNSFNNDTTKIIVDWIKHDTIISEDKSKEGWWKKNNSMVYYLLSSGSGPIASPTGISGSMARFTIVNDRMYTVSTSSSLNIFNISSPNNPTFSNKINIRGSIETIFSLKDNLFIGSPTGMLIYNISSPDNPVLAGQFSHGRSCDPVIADNNYAYVTLHSGSVCGGAINELDILQLNNLTNSQLIKTYNLTSPHGLSKDGNLLFICDGDDGLKVFEASDIKNLRLIKHISNLQTYDVIANNNIALVVAKNGLYQFDYSNPAGIRLLSSLSITK